MTRPMLLRHVHASENRLVIHTLSGDTSYPILLACYLRVCTMVNLQDEPPPGKESVEGIAVQQRCEVQPGGRRGVVEFVGEVEGLQVR